MATLLSLCEDVSDLVSLERPTAIVGSTNQTARRLLQVVRETCEELKDRYEWPKLVREHEITTANGTASYALPSDYDRYINDTAWDQSNYWRMRGSLTPEQWQFYQNAIVSLPANRKRFRVKYDSDNSALRIFIDPTPTGVETLVIEYISNQWCESSGGTGQADWAADTDVPRVPDELIRLGARWRMLRIGGFSYADERADYDSRVNQLISHSAPGTTINVGTRPDYFYNLPEGNIAI
jgi:5'(3')-deoxyribonucleotidase